MGGFTIEDLPEGVFAEIFKLLPARQVAGACAMVCRSWRDVAGEEGMWQDLGRSAGLTETDGMRWMMGWKSLFGRVFGQNLVACPTFDRVLHMDMEAMKHQTLSPWEPKHRLLLDRIPSLHDDHEDSHTYSFWAVEGGSVFQRGGGDGVMRESPPVGCPPCPPDSSSPSSDSSSVIATSYDWGKVQQCISFPTFSKRFLDSSPPLLVSAMYSGVAGVDSKLKLQLLIRDDLKNSVLFWDSGEIYTVPGEWREMKAIIRGYPAGMRSVILKIGGMSVGAKKKHGFYGAKFTNIKLKFVPHFELKFFDKDVLNVGKTVLYKP